MAYRLADGTWVTAYTATYDAGGNRVRVDELDGSFFYGYDQNSQLTAELRTGDDPFAPLYSYTYTYDGVGNRRVLDKGIEIIESTYNAADELTGTQTFGPAVASESTFEPFTRAPYSRNAFALNLPLAAGRRYTIEDATLSLVGATGTWDAAHRWDLALQARTASLGVSSTLATSTFQSAGAGMVELTPGVQLDSDETPVLSLAVSKVAAPNLLCATGSVRVTSQEKLGETAFGYDANGNTTSEVSASQSVTLTWDGENRLLTVTTDGETETYAYAATGLRRKKTTGAGTTNFVWDAVNLLAELDASLATVAQYTDWPGQWGGLSSARRSGSSQFFGFDLSANTRVLMDAAAGVTGAYLYSAFGVELVAGGSSSTPYGYGGMVGYYRDTTERLYVRARHYAPAAGIWLSPDVLSFGSSDAWELLAIALEDDTSYEAGGASPYLYADAAAVLVADPLGLQPPPTAPPRPPSRPGPRPAPPPGTRPGPRPAPPPGTRPGPPPAAPSPWPGRIRRIWRVIRRGVGLIGGSPVATGVTNVLLCPGRAEAPGIQPAPKPRPKTWRFTKDECEEACKRIFGRKKQRKECLRICKDLGGSECQDLAARCGHLERHTDEGDPLVCWRIWNDLCFHIPK